MSPIIDLLRSEIVRLKAELSRASQRRSKFIDRIDTRIADIVQRLQAAERMLATYAGESLEFNGDADPSAGDHKFDHIRLQGAPSDADIAMVDLPATLRGRSLRPGAKRTKIIRAVKAFLDEKETATRGEIFVFLQQQGIMGNEKNPPAYLSVILSYAKEIFATDGVFWSLKGDTHKC